MKRVSLLFILLVFCGAAVTLTAQKPYNPKAKVTAKMDKKNYTGYEVLGVRTEPSLFETMLEQNAQTYSVDKETWIGTTDYDLQSNSAGQNRLTQKSGGNTACVWIYGTGDLGAGVPDRGTGYNCKIDDEWGDTPDERLEVSTRTGWPNLVVTSSGQEFIVNHSADNDLHTLRRAAGEPNWTEDNIPTNVTPGLLWPRAAVSGETIHVIAVSTPVANDGTVWLGMDPAILYFRSLDGGATWDIQDYQIPGTTSSEFVGLDADSYVIEADENGNVAIGIFNDWADVVMLKSDSNGDIGSWETRIVNDFPLDLYVIDSGYTIDDIGGVDPDAPDSMAVFTSDGSGSIAFDASGQAHMVFGHMYVLDADLTDANSSFFPGWSGVAYWNESMADNAHQEIIEVGNSIDINGNDTLDLTGEIAAYFLNLTSFLNLAIDEDDHLMLSYSMVMEDTCSALGQSPCGVKEDSTPAANQHFRHVWLTASSDGGATWQPPYNTNNEDVVLFPILLEQREVVFSDVHANGSGNFSLYYQVDNEPGLHVRGDTDPVNSNTIAVWDFNKLEIFPELVSTEEVVAAADLKFGINPNPAKDVVEVNYQLPDAAKTTITISNIVGQQIISIDLGNQASGAHTRNLNVEGLTNGVYIVNLRTNNKIATQKIVINK